MARQFNLANGDGKMEKQTEYNYRASQWLTVPKHAIERAICNLSLIEGLALARAAYRAGDDGYASLEDAKEIVDAIQHRVNIS